MKLLFFIFGIVMLTAARYLEDINEVECSIVAILSNLREESDECNLKNLMTPEKPPAIKSSTKRDIKKLPFLPSCLPNEQCRVNGRRTCICAQKNICEPEQGNQKYSCVAFSYFL
ncbi:unnamed protein product [Caenorhabditis angaria]|uniref:EB domain-containing protein n=1 Tax=Caenorhabditis angaria TaxID=860376 RepID=A0A9P1IX91_9PELO|nr:unnamed protein product [Caenorhabditis angaria]